MLETIKEKLKEIEEKDQVRIIHAVESGSRAWGFASPDSDYDVRFIYIRKPEAYMHLEKTRDVIEWQLDDTLDINGWDLQKALRLLHRSNPTLFEWNESPIIYRTTEAWAELQPLIRACFMEKSGLYHYLSMAKSNYREYLKSDMVRLKKYFYVLRPVLACRWILEYQSAPPMAFSKLAEACLPTELKPEVDRLLEMKMAASEMEYGPRIDAINSYLNESIQEISDVIAAMPSRAQLPWKDLNDMFIRLVREHAP